MNLYDEGILEEMFAENSHKANRYGFNHRINQGGNDLWKIEQGKVINRWELLGQAIFAGIVTFVGGAFILGQEDLNLLQQSLLGGIFFILGMILWSVDKNLNAHKRALAAVTKAHQICWQGLKHQEEQYQKIEQLKADLARYEQKFEMLSPEDLDLIEKVEDFKNHLDLLNEKLQNVISSNKLAMKQITVGGE